MNPEWLNLLDGSWVANSGSKHKSDWSNSLRTAHNLCLSRETPTWTLTFSVGIAQQLPNSPWRPSGLNRRMGTCSFFWTSTRSGYLVKNLRCHLQCLRLLSRHGKVSGLQYRLLFWSQLPTDAHLETAVDGPGTWVPGTHAGDQDRILGSWL